MGNTRYNADLAILAPPSKKRKLEDGAAASVKKTKTTEEDADEDEEDEDDAAEAPEDEEDEQEQEEDEPAVRDTVLSLKSITDKQQVKTKVIQGSEAKTSAAEAKDEAYEGEA